MLWRVEGWYQPDPGQTDCKQASRGFFVGFKGQASQTPCSGGLYSNKTGAIECDICLYFPNLCLIQDVIVLLLAWTGPIGTYSDPGTTPRTECLPCKPGLNNVRDLHLSLQRLLHVLAIGSYARDRHYTACVLCDPGQFAAQPGFVVTVLWGFTFEIFLCFRMASCQECPKGFFAGGSGQTECVGCLPGEKFVKVAFDQRLLWLGTYAMSLASTACTMCSSGTYQNVTNGTACVDCQPGSYADVERSVCFVFGTATSSSFSIQLCVPVSPADCLPIMQWRHCC